MGKQNKYSEAIYMCWCKRSVLLIYVYIFLLRGMLQTNEQDLSMGTFDFIGNLIQYIQNLNLK